MTYIREKCSEACEARDVTGDFTYLGRVRDPVGTKALEARRCL